MSKEGNLQFLYHNKALKKRWMVVTWWGTEVSLYSSPSFLGSRVACSSLLIAKMLTGERFALCPLRGDGWRGTGEQGALMLGFSDSFANFSDPEYCSSSSPLRSNDAPQLHQVNLCFIHPFSIFSSVERGTW